MEQAVVRIKSLLLKNIKNTGYGLVKMPLSDGEGTFAEILGIYGQNGSGKTAIIDSLYIVQMLLTGRSLPDELGNYINIKERESEIQVEFTVKEKNRIFEITYFVRLRRTSGKGVEIVEESLMSSKKIEEKRTKKQPFMEYKRRDESPVFTPKIRFDELLFENKNSKTDLTVARKIAEINHCSYIFGETSLNIFEQAKENAFADYSFMIRALHRYALMNLFVIRNTHSGAISSEILLPMAFQVVDEKSTTKGDFVITLREPTVLLEESYVMLTRIIDEINIVLQTIIPGLMLGIYDYGTMLQEDGLFARKIDLVSKREDMEIPIRYESEGIIKIISILNVLIRAYNNPGICLAVDELDAGIYEYLLGELLDIFNKGGKGQLIFTSHNLRSLEMLEPKSILFSTANPKNRYIRIQNIRETNNLRDVYLRSITLGGQKECIYTDTDSLKIARAFRKAGREIANEQKE